MVMLTEKYRPKEFEEVIGLNSSIQKLLGNDMPHFLFEGSPGTGKTTAAKIIINKLGCDSLELNASDERGIDVIRDKVKVFAQTKSSNNELKIIFLDEFDSVTKDAQLSLRRIIEKYQVNCRFILACNYLNKIDNSLHSRCTIISFTQEDKGSIVERLKSICEKEKINYEDNVIELLVDKLYPDMRSMLNKIQELGVNDIVTKEMISLDSKTINELINYFEDKNFSKCVETISKIKMDIHKILNGLMKIVKTKREYSIKRKISIIEAIAETEFRLGLSVDKEVQINGGVVRILKAFMVE